MIGVVTGEEYIAFEFRPVFASDKMKWAKIVINTKLFNGNSEYGFAITRDFKLCIYKGVEMHFRDPMKLFRKC